MTHTETTTQGPTVEALLCYPLIGYLSKCLFCMLLLLSDVITNIDTLLYCSIKTISFSVESYCNFTIVTTWVACVQPPLQLGIYRVKLVICLKSASSIAQCSTLLSDPISSNSYVLVID